MLLLLLLLWQYTVTRTNVKINVAYKLRKESGSGAKITLFSNRLTLEALGVKPKKPPKPVEQLVSGCKSLLIEPIPITHVTPIAVAASGLYRVLSFAALQLRAFLVWGFTL